MKIRTLKVEQNRLVHHSIVTNEYLQGSSMFKSTIDGIERKKIVDKQDKERKDGDEINCLDMLGAEITEKFYGKKIDRKSVV